MTLLLASVTGPDEASTALAHGADIIDLKDVARGALGALAIDELRACVRVVAGRRPVSAVVEAPEPRDIVASVRSVADEGIGTVKIGLFAGVEAGFPALATVADRVKLVGVMFADRPVDRGLIPLMAQSGFAGAMLDTARKGAGGLLEHKDIGALRQFVLDCRAHGLTAGLAGSLEPPDIPRLMLVAPDVLGFRSALCGRNGRSGPIDPAAMRLVRELIPGDGDPADATPRGRKWSGYATGPKVATDRIFVHDLVIPVRIGVYSRELDRPQKVRFSVDVEVARSGRDADMRDVFSYDLILDGIRIICAEAHIPLVQTLAERVAELILRHPRVVNATVKVEKLEVGPGSVGVEIRRERKADVAQVHQLFSLPAAE